MPKTMGSSPTLSSPNYGDDLGEQALELNQIQEVMVVICIACQWQGGIGCCCQWLPIKSGLEIPVLCLCWTQDININGKMMFGHDGRPEAASIFDLRPNPYITQREKPSFVRGASRVKAKL